jgi:hypothetical protein
MMAKSGAIEVIFKSHEPFQSYLLKFMHSEKATKFCEISILLLFYILPVKIKVEISQNFAAFSEYKNFNWPGRFSQKGWLGLASLQVTLKELMGFENSVRRYGCPLKYFFVCLFVTEEILYSITAVSDQGS